MDINNPFMTFLSNNYKSAINIKVILPKREKLHCEQIKRMLDAGAVREQGIIEAIKNDYGFIKPADSLEQIYFRLEDVNMVDNHQRLTEGTDVEFFVITENSKGKMSDRAVNLTILPPGSVILELCLYENVVGIVTMEPTFIHHRQQEEPGIVKLDIPIEYNNKTLTEIELWGRCFPDGLILKEGDKISFNIQNYRPDKCIFGRNIKILSFRSFGREIGYICSVKEQQGFGFIKPFERDVDLYFRLKEVVDFQSESVFLRDTILIENHNKIEHSAEPRFIEVSFDVIQEESRDKSFRLKASRVSINNTVNELPNNVESTSTVFNNMLPSTLRMDLLATQIQGVVMRESKRDLPGIIRIKASDIDNNSELESNSNKNSELAIIKAISEFKDNTNIKDIILECLTKLQVNTYKTIFTQNGFDCVGFETKNNNNIQGKYCLKLYKMNKEDYSLWIENKKNDVSNEKAASPVKTGITIDVMFNKNDTIDNFGPITKPLTVIFDVYHDLKLNQNIGKVVRLTDEPVYDDNNTLLVNQIGTIDIVVVRHGKFGFIRCIPSDEKIFWHSSGISQDTNINDLVESKEVLFSIRRRGGSRCASDIKIIDSNHESSCTKKVLVEGSSVGVVIQNPVDKTKQVILVDVTNCPLLLSKYWNTNSITSSENKVVDKQWEKLNGLVIEEKPIVESVSDARYFPPLMRLPVNIKSDGEGIDADLYEVGDIVECQGMFLFYKYHFFYYFSYLIFFFFLVFAEWSLNRNPVEVSIMKKQSAESIKKSGTIQRLKVRVKSQDAAQSVIELVEIKEKGVFYYCDIRELPQDNESIQQGDRVEFMVIPNSLVAISIVLIKSLIEDRGIVFKRNPVNAMLKQSQVNTGHRGITMAQGPPNDTSVGFKKAWRGEFYLKDFTLPWTHIISNLPSTPN
jgi:cold shock CspA family protein